MTLRERTFHPSPHVFVHGEKLVQAETLQWTGHGPPVHSLTVVVGGHDFPPCTPDLMTVRVLRAEPWPHETEQPLQADHSDILQSRLQLHSLQGLVSLCFGQ